MDEAIKILRRYSSVEEKTNPGLVVYKGRRVPREVGKLAERALYELISLKDVKRIIDSSARFDYYYMGDGRGLIGALSAIGNVLVGKDHTYEILAYRKPENIGKKRKIDEGSVIASARNPNIFANYDPGTGRILVTPRGGDPVLFGVRGESPNDVYSAFLRIRSFEEIDRWMIFITNQGTDAHLKRFKKICRIRAFEQVGVEGELRDKPIEKTGGHVIFKVSDETGCITCIAYFESGKMTKVVRELMSHDKIRVYGGVKVKDGELTLNTQKIELLMKQRRYAERPICIRCGKKMRSQGRDKGYFCKCGYHVSEVRSMVHGSCRVWPSILLPPYRSMRHLTKPIKRYGRENERRRTLITFSKWCSFIEDSFSEK